MREENSGTLAMDRKTDAVGRPVSGYRAVCSRAVADSGNVQARWSQSALITLTSRFDSGACNSGASEQ
jgi:hypothetical protein